MVANGLVHRDGPAATVITNLEVEDLGLAEFGALGRSQLDPLAQFDDVSGGRPYGRILLIVDRRTDLLERCSQHTAALGQLEDRLLDRLHLVGMAELAGALLVVGGLVADNQGLRRLPGGGTHYRVARSQGRDDQHRNAPTLGVDLQQVKDFSGTDDGLR